MTTLRRRPPEYLSAAAHARLAAHRLELEAQAQRSIRAVQTAAQRHPATPERTRKP